MDTRPLLRVTAAGRFLARSGALPTEIDRALLAASGGRRLWSVAAEGQTWSVLSLPTPDAAVHLIWPAGAEDPLVDFAGTVEFAAEILSHFLTNPYEAITVADAQGRLRWVSPVHARFFGLDRGDALGRPAREVIENTPLPEVARSGQAEIGRVQTMKGVSRVVSRFPIRRDGQVVGAIGQVMFKGPEQAAAFGREVDRLRAELDHYKRELAALRGTPSSLDALIGDGAAMSKLKADLARVAPLDVPVLIRGESGTGKELVATALHRLSDRRDGPMVAVNAAALPDSLVESELFGTEPGAFTGAQSKGRPGKLEAADGGTLFLDEIGDMAPETQAKVLRVLEEGRFERLGGTATRAADFRLVTATNRPLEKLIADESFRADLYFRIGVVTLTLPPLRDRREDIPAIAATILERTAERHGLSARVLAPDAIAALASHDWPGNVRELINVIQNAAIFADGPELRASDLPAFTAVARAPDRGGLKPRLGAIEADLIRQAIEQAGGNKKQAAVALGISRGYLYKRLREISA